MQAKVPMIFAASHIYVHYDGISHYQENSKMHSRISSDDDCIG